MKKTVAMFLVLMMVWGLAACAVESTTTTETQVEIEFTQDNAYFEELKRDWYYGWVDAQWVEYVDSSVPELKTENAHPETIWEAYLQEVNRRMEGERFWTPLEEEFFKQMGYEAELQNEEHIGWIDGHVTAPGARAVIFKCEDCVTVVYMSNGEDYQLTLLMADHRSIMHVYNPYQDW